ncbi:mitotic apparatus protein p62-like [Gouania willdenowi]|uniref:mitotic apparatus protein p62-like n=1 Tax=Gouania willdenowi TaxID=441366 RepID=UPI0010562588|nr:mitotic apparatus protein p62-like [Gouania willdenowi]
MEESYETFEEDLWPPKTDPLQKPVRPTRRPEMLSTRKVPEAPPPQQLRAEPKTFPREPSLPQTASLQKALPIQNQSPVEKPWENVTLNRCLLVAITILVLTSGFQRLNENFHGREDVEDEESGLRVRRSGSLRHRGHMMEPQTSLWDLVFMWLPDFNDDDDDDDENEEEDEDGEVKRGKSKRGEKSWSSLRNKPPPAKKLMKKKDGKLKGRRDEKETTGRVSEEGDDEDDQDVPQRTVQSEKKKEKKKTQKE